MAIRVDSAVWRRAQAGHLRTWQGYAAREDRSEQARRERHRALLEAICALDPIKAGERILEIGGGLDTMVALFPGIRPVTLDSLAAPLGRLGLERHLRPTAGLLEQLPFRSAAFDRVFLFNVLDHVREPSTGLDEIARVLRPQGLLVVSVDTYRGMRYLHRRFKKRLQLARRVPTKHPWVFSYGRVRSMMRRSAFEIVSGPCHIEGSKARRSFFAARRPAQA